MNWQHCSERDPEVMLHKPVFKSTRLTLEYILERLGQGATPQELSENQAGLRPEHIRVAQSYAALDGDCSGVVQTGSQSASRT
jgi:uncharacterized protein (DUF433 family)